jgi:hypothetical protein
MKPSVRTASECRRLLVLCATVASLTGPLPAARAADALCPNPAQDPRLEELAQSDPDDPSIDI